MMEDHEFCDSCPGCRPAIFSMETGRPLPPEDPIMIVVNDIWDTQTTYAQRRAFIEFTLHNSRNPQDMRLVAEVNQMIEAALKESEHS